jgi:nucleotide-binding universal stress UspA family protein
MTHVLVATSSVHTTAVACDYLQGRLDGDDQVTVLAVAEPGLSARDPGDATNVARTRLVAPAVETLVREGTPAAEIRAVAAERDVDELVVGPRRGDPATSGTAPGETVTALVADSEWPVVVVPLATLQ